MKKKLSARKASHKKTAVKKRAPRDTWTIKRIMLPLTFAALALVASSSFTYTTRVAGNVLGDDDAQKEAEKQAEDQAKEQEKQQEEAQKRAEEQHREEVQKQEEAAKHAEEVRREEIKRASGATGTAGVQGTKFGVKIRVDEDGHVEAETRTEAEVKFKFHQENGEIRIKAEDASGEEVHTREQERVREALEQELEDEEIEVSTDDGHLAIEHNAVRARVHFPLSIDPVSNNLIVNTPAGERTVGVLPDVAVANLLSKGLLSTEASDSVELVMDDGKLVYEVEGEKEHKLFGFIPLKTHRNVKVSALTGEVLSSEQTFLSGLIDLFSL